MKRHKISLNARLRTMGNPTYIKETFIKPEEEKSPATARTPS